MTTTQPRWEPVDNDTAESGPSLDSEGRLNFNHAAVSLRAQIVRAIDITEDGCWEYQGRRSRGGYCDMRVAGYQYRVHRVSFAVFRGPFANDLLICHTCDNPCCCNPAHLFSGDHKINALDASAKGRLNTPGPRGPSHPCATVDDLRAKQAILRYLRGESQRSIAADLGISQGTVSNWVLGKTRPELVKP